jgi:hypothetical protein
VRQGLAVLALVVGSSIPAFGQTASISRAGVVEGDAGVRSVEVIVTLSQPSTKPVTMAWATSDGTAASGSDFAAASGTLTFAVGERTKRIAISVHGDTAVEASETFQVQLTTASGATIGTSSGTVTIVNDDGLQGGLSVYEVRFTFTGHLGSLASANCPGIRSNGTVVLSGLVAGHEAVPASEDIEYRGVMELLADLDLCEATRPPGSSEDRLCVISVVGGGAVDAEIAVYEGDRGLYVKNQRAPGPFASAAFGDCGSSANAEEQNMFPDDSMANVFNGLDFPMRSGPLRPGRYVDDNVVFEVLRLVRRP